MDKIIIITGINRSGKTSILRELKDGHFINIVPIRLSTTIKKNETNKNDFSFLSRKDFEDGVLNGLFVAWEESNGIFTGLLFSEIEYFWEHSFVPIVESSVYLAEKISSFYKEESIVVFVEPPSDDSLRDRLVSEKLPEKKIQKALQDLKNDKLSFLLKMENTINVKNGDIHRMVVSIRKKLFGIFKSTMAT